MVETIICVAKDRRAAAKLGLVTLSMTFAAITAMRQVLRDMSAQGGIEKIMARNDSWDSVLELVGFDTIKEWSEKYAPRSDGD
ncbi:MAG: hypothetical protein O3C40_37360 [Planctomycetota bacterium]|nr:hypothetical protein [Planctomycetota bacterium]